MSRMRATIALAMLIAEGVLSTVGLAGELSKTQQILDENAAEQKYTFLLFYRDDNQATRAMAASLKTGLAANSTQATACFVSVADPAEQDVVKRFGVARAP